MTALVAFPPIRVLVTCDVRLYREGLARSLGAEQGVRVVGTAATPRDALNEAVVLAPDILVLGAPIPQSVELIRALAEQVPRVKVVAIAVADVDEEIFAVAEAGAAGFVTVEQPHEDLVAILRSVRQDEMPCSPRATAALLRHVGELAAERDRTSTHVLTQREMQIAELIDRGCSNKEIAEQLFIELPTVKTHVHNILEKLQVRRRAEAAAWLRNRRASLPPELVDATALQSLERAGDLNVGDYSSR